MIFLESPISQAVRAEEELWGALEIQRIWRGCDCGWEWIGDTTGGSVGVTHG